MHHHGPPFLSSYTVQDSLLREQFKPQWVDLPSSVRIILHRRALGILDLGWPSSPVILNCVGLKSNMKTCMQSGLGFAVLTCEVAKIITFSNRPGLTLGGSFVKAEFISTLTLLGIRYMLSAE